MMETMSTSASLQKVNEISEKNFIGKLIEVKTIDGNNHTGHLFVVDPESKSVVLALDGQLTILPCNAVNDINVHDGVVMEHFSFYSDNKESISDEDFIRKEKLMSWLKLHLIDVQEDGVSIKFQDHLTIEPPYDVDHCYCSNIIILERIRDIINKMPS